MKRRVWTETMWAEEERKKLKKFYDALEKRVKKLEGEIKKWQKET